MFTRSYAFVLFLGDAIIFFFAVWAALFLRTFSLPSSSLFVDHLVPFSLAFVIWAMLSVAMDVYDASRVVISPRKLLARLVTSHIVNAITITVIFFMVPYFGITPKTVLVLFLILSSSLGLAWHLLIFPRLPFQREEASLLVGNSSEITELEHAFQTTYAKFIRIVGVISPTHNYLPGAIKSLVDERHPRFIIADFEHPNVANACGELYSLMPEKRIEFLDAEELYEEMFGRVALSHINGVWISRNISPRVHIMYDHGKRIVDVCCSALLTVLLLPLLPFIALAIKLEDRGAVFIEQVRVGYNGEPISIFKFRSMERNESTLNARGSENKVTRVGQFLRVTRLDELPQLWNVLRGDISLIGPRPELSAGVERYKKAIPYYDLRHIVKPGLSGWAQIYHDNHPHHLIAVDETREKLSYDLYYIKNRSLALDLMIVLRTLRRVLLVSGR
jgi:exopolysaccharide biosynthesis polyprenyl glycosylphosphotransferase